MEYWIVFREKTTNNELCAITLKDVFPGEIKATIELLANENGISENSISYGVEKRTHSGDTVKEFTIRSEKRGRLLLLAELVKDGLISLEYAAKKAGVTPKKFTLLASNEGVSL